MTQKTFLKWLIIYGQAVKELSWVGGTYIDGAEREEATEFWKERKRTARNKLLRGMLGEQ